MSQSNGQHDWDELLSAYADGEVSPSERATVESLLASTPAARQALDEFRSLSQAVRNLPTLEAPPHFAATVKSRIPAHVTPAAASAKRRFRGYRREWLAGLSAVAMTIFAAGLLSVQLQNQTALFPMRFGDSAEGLTLAPIAGQPATTVEMRTADRGRTAGEAAGTHLAAVADPSPAERELLRNESTSSPVSGAMLTFAPARSEALLRDRSEAEWLANRSPAASVEEVERLREVLPYLRLQDESGQSIGNVELVVVDAQRVANQFQVLLMQNGVTTLDARTIDIDADVALAEAVRSKTDAEQPATAEDLIAVYAEAPGEPLSKTLEELIKQREILSLRLQPPLQVAPDEGPSTADKSGVGERKLNLKQITDAYFTQQLEDEAALWSEEFDIVSAADAIAVARGEPADNRLQDFAERVAQKSAARFSVPRMAKAISGSGPQRASQSLGRATKGNVELNENVASFNTLVKLPVPVLEGEAAPVSQQRANLDVTQNFRRSTRPVNAPAAAPEDLTQMRSRFARAAPDSVRVLFVLHPVANPPPTSPAAMPAGR